MAVDPFWNQTVLYLPMLGGAPGRQLWRDYSQGGSRYLITRGNVQLSNATAVFGGLSAVFDGNGDWIEHSPHADFTFGTGDFTVEAWVNTTVGGKAVLDYFQSAVANTWQLFVNAAGRLEWWSTPSGTGTRMLTATAGDVRSGTWRHVAACRAAGVLRLFTDGAQVGELADTRSYASAALFGIGAQISTRNAAYDWLGYIDEVRITKAPRYVASFPVPTNSFLDDVPPDIRNWVESSGVVYDFGVSSLWMPAFSRASFSGVGPGMQALVGLDISSNPRPRYPGELILP